ncbi:3-phenylpropionate/cinnamic acid dioxygenase subunit beta [Amycolatopsis sp. GM8]|uniref:3-phenylpropionate/cinnamic acid dioxygenase subunit beta n=1 Tax=Amycolatopsis sp. GM8 TaxID=2896530 RepID=UPI001F016B23|nr:3-phenylpropionate/cinnamic acid dioxygenase subunit beta [Amycolatopsis sp. GM8]
MSTHTDTEAAIDPAKLARMYRQYEVEEFYTDEAALLDSHSYDQWLALFTDDTHYFMPIRRTMSRRELSREFTKPGEMAFFDDDKQILSGRVAKLATGTAWAEDPPSRTRHLVTNVRIIEDTGTELTAETNFLLYRTRLKSEEDQWIGRREDVLRRTDDGFRIARRYIFLEQTVLLSQNLSNFF